LWIVAGIGIVGTFFTYKYYLNDVDKMSPESFRQPISGKESSPQSDSLDNHAKEMISTGNAQVSKPKTKTMRSYHVITRTRIYDIEVCRGDILEEKTDAIVIPMSSSLALDQNELAKSVAQKAGEQFTNHLQNYLSKHGELKTNAVTLSNASGDLNCKYIVCAASPTWNGGYGSEVTDLFQTIYNTLEAVDRELLESIAIPAIGINQFHFPKEKSANIIFDAITTYFNDKHTVARASSKRIPLRNIRIVIADPQTLDVFIDEFDKRKRYGQSL
jgi:O-acetyl-ADP-ribose deacetylase (regulator of RNase III)